MEKNNNKILLVIIIALVFGLAGGITGELISRVYIMERTFNIPLTGEINLNDNNISNQGFVIRDAKKVVVEQNDKVADTVNSVKSEMVGIFKSIKPKSAAADAEFNAADYNRVGDETGQGFIITSDGWIVSDFLPPTYKNDLATKTKEEILGGYFIALNDKTVYIPDSIVTDEASGYAFWHISANDLSVRPFADLHDLSKGSLMLAMNWDNDVLLTSLSDINLKNDALVKSSDLQVYQLTVADPIADDMKDGFLFNMNGDLVGLINPAGEIDFIGNLGSCLKCLFAGRDIIAPTLGFNYVDLGQILDPAKKLPKKGVIIYPDTKGVAVVKNGPANQAGLLEGDIVTKVNNTEINDQNSLAYLLSQHQAGDEVLLEYIRSGETKTVNVILGQ